MTQQAVVSIVKTEAQAALIVEDLQKAGFSMDDVSVLVPAGSRQHELGHEKNTKMPEGAATGAATGGVLGGTLGLLAGIGAIAIPGLGPFIAAGPIMGLLGGAAAGATAGGLTGALVGLGIPEYEAKQYESRLRNGGNLLISVHTNDRRERELAKEVFERHDADDIATVGEKTADEKIERR
jgi:uncharacterized membrane protein